MWIMLGTFLKVMHLFMKGMASNQIYVYIQELSWAMVNASTFNRYLIF